MLNIKEEDNKIIISFIGSFEDKTLDIKDLNPNKIIELYNYYVEQENIIIKECGLDEIRIDQEKEISINIYFEDFKNKELLKQLLKNINNEIIINIYTDSHKETIDFLDSIESKYLENTFINYKDTPITATVEEYKNMVNELYKIIDNVNKYNLSPIEQIMYVYDIVKSNIYEDVDDFNKVYDSRAPHKVIQSKKIVCSGFSNIFNFIMRELNIPSEKVLIKYKNKEQKHQRSMIYINDTKYGVEGVFQIDPTGDSKKNDSYLNNYNFFLFELAYSKKYNKNEVIYEPELEFFKKYKTFDEIYESDLDIEDIAKLFTTMRKITNMASQKQIKIDSSKILLDLLTGEEKKELNIIYKNLRKIQNTELSIEAFAETVYNVRKAQYLNQTTDHIPNEEEILNITMRKYMTRAKIINNREYEFATYLSCKLLEFPYITKKTKEKNKYVRSKEIKE